MAPHRMRIMQLLRDKADLLNGGRAMFIGCGPGFEIELTNKKSRKTIAFDLEIDPFLIKKHKKVEFRNQYFDGNTDESFNEIYLIEILEHLTAPFELIKNCCDVLEPNGLIYLTTATNMPQFDHVYNFEVSHSVFENKISEMSLDIVYKENIRHEYIVSDIESQNCFYVLKKSV
jgi:2-polyprenyl-3-methyl-5-hydroxy-6-metoxy-1,4-benzoquinol methylase